MNERFSERIEKIARNKILGAAATGAMFLGGVGCADAKFPLGNSEVPATPTASQAGASPRSADWYLTAGPHVYEGSNSIGAVNTHGIRDALDLSPRGSEGKTCPTDPITTVAFPSPAEGQVIIVGDENNRNDPKHSEVIIKLKDGTQVGLMHLAGIKVQRGQDIKFGAPLGFASCEVPGEGGYASSPHVHIFAQDEQGKPIPIDGATTNQGTVHANPENYNGTFVKPDGSTITATTGRCGPEQSSIDSCGGKRNDIKGFLEILQTIQKGKIVFNLRYANGSPVFDSQIDLYNQKKDINGNPTINGERLKEDSTGKTGATSFDAKPGQYAVIFSEYGRNKIAGQKFNSAVFRPGVADITVNPNQTTTRNFTLGMIFIHFIEDPENPARNPYTNTLCVSAKDNNRNPYDVKCVFATQSFREQTALIDLTPGDTYETSIDWFTTTSGNQHYNIGKTPIREGEIVELYCTTYEPKNRISKEIPGCSTTPSKK